MALFKLMIFAKRSESHNLTHRSIINLHGYRTRDVVTDLSISIYVSCVSVTCFLRVVIVGLIVL